MRAAVAFNHETKLPGKRNGALGAIGLEVLRCLLRLRGRKDGRLDPTYQWIADKIHRSRSAVGEALDRLKTCGFLDWIRRCVPIENAEPDEQQGEQISNAFILLQPPTVRECVRRMLRKPSEFVRAVAEKLARQKRLDTATVDDVIAEVQSAELRAILARVRLFVNSANPPSGHTDHSEFLLPPLRPQMIGPHCHYTCLISMDQAKYAEKLFHLRQILSDHRSDFRPVKILSEK
jgi:hypothetical protein